MTFSPAARLLAGRGGLHAALDAEGFDAATADTVHSHRLACRWWNAGYRESQVVMRGSSCASVLSSFLLFNNRFFCLVTVSSVV